MKAAGGGKTDRDRRVQMTTRDVAERERHDEHTQAERERNAGESNANLREGRGKHCASTSAKDQPERSDELCREGTTMGHG